MSQHSRRAGSAAFTLIELLVVIAIIAFLAAILFPVFAKAREKARQSTCLSNQKQISIAVLAYAQDYDEKFNLGNYVYVDPVYGSTNKVWWALVDPYIKSGIGGTIAEAQAKKTNVSVWVCPSFDAPNAGGLPGVDGFRSYTSNSWVMPRHGVGWAAPDGSYHPVASLASIQEPSRQFTFVEARGASGGSFGKIDPSEADGPLSTALAQITPKLLESNNSQSYAAARARHNGGANYAFADGHSKWIKGPFDLVSPNALTAYRNPTSPAAQGYFKQD